MNQGLRRARLERYIPAELLAKILSAAQHASDAWAAGRLRRERRRRSITGRVAPPRGSRRVLDADVGEYAVLMPAMQRVDGRESAGALPVWVDSQGRVRLAVGRSDARNGSEFDQLMVAPEVLLRAVAIALADAQEMLDDEHPDRVAAALAHFSRAVRIRERALASSTAPAVLDRRSRA
jgi:hypothetical protein